MTKATPNQYEERNQQMRGSLSPLVWFLLALAAGLLLLAAYTPARARACSLSPEPVREVLPGDLTRARLLYWAGSRYDVRFSSSGFYYSHIEGSYGYHVGHWILEQQTLVIYEWYSVQPSDSGPPAILPNFTAQPAIYRILLAPIDPADPLGTIRADITSPYTFTLEAR